MVVPAFIGLAGIGKFVAIFFLTLALTSADPGCRICATRPWVPEIVSGCGMAQRDGVQPNVSRPGPDIGFGYPIAAIGLFGFSVPVVKSEKQNMTSNGSSWALVGRNER